ncbi:MAG: phosphatidate cytidylyltransferase [Desulfatiglandales bacterium]
MNQSWSPHIKRLITGLILVSVVFFLFSSEKALVFELGVIVVSQIALFELLGFDRRKNLIKRCLIHGVSLTVLSLFFLRQWIFLPVSLFIPFMIISFLLFVEKRATEDELKWWAFSIFGLLYLSLPFGLLFSILLLPHGKLWIMFLVVVVAAGDISAYYVGKGFGRRLLLKEISPKKTVEGAIGSVVGSVLAGLLFFNLFKLEEMGLKGVLLILGISLLSQAGDLFESYLKRVHKRKDSGNILPGHGGILDRVDGLIFGIPVLYLFLSLKYSA